MPNNEKLLRGAPVKTDAELLADMGTDPEAWAQQLRKVMPLGVNTTLMAAWFHHAIEAGRQAAAPQVAPAGEPPSVRSPAVWGASGFELRSIAASARASLARLREFVGFEDLGAAAAFDLVDWHLGSITNDPRFGDAGDR